MNAVVPVKADLHGRMDIAELEKAIEAALQQGQQPFMVSATAGTTVMGGFDYFRPLRTICDKYKLWLHVDAAWGTAAAFSSCANEWIAGIDKADSVAWDAHKVCCLIRIMRIFRDRSRSTSDY